LPSSGGGLPFDATAWAVVALVAAGSPAKGMITTARTRLAAGQLKDGRVTISEEYPQTFWPTPLAILAWQGSVTQSKAQAAAINFLLNTAGMHWKKDLIARFVMITSIKGGRGPRTLSPGLSRPR